MQKKANWATENMGVLILVAIVVVVAIAIWGRGSASASQLFDQTQLKTKNELCEASGKLMIFNTGEVKEKIEGSKGDDFPDDCDICLGGNNKKVSNSYGISDDCFVDPAQDKKINNYKDMCKSKGGCYISETYQCCIVEAQSKCGPECK